MFKVEASRNLPQATESTKVGLITLIFIEFVDRFKNLHNNSGRFVSGVPGAVQGIPNTGPTNAQQLY